jgi:hypothetical protein
MGDFLVAPSGRYKGEVRCAQELLKVFAPAAFVPNDEISMLPGSERNSMSAWPTSKQPAPPEQTHPSALADHVARTTRLGLWVLISESWYEPSLASWVNEPVFLERLRFAGPRRE